MTEQEQGIELQQKGLFTCYITHNPELGMDITKLTYKDKDPAKSISLRIAPHFGNTIIGLRYGDRDLIFTDLEEIGEGKRGWTGAYVLFPFPGRIESPEGIGYHDKGKFISLEEHNKLPSVPNLAHSLVEDKPWETTNIAYNKDGVSITSSYTITPKDPEFKYFPYNSELSMTHTVARDGIHVSYQVINNERRSMHFSLGLHPYWRYPDGKENTFISVPGESIIETDEKGLPTGQKRSVEGTHFDLREPQSLTGMAFDHAWTDLNDKHSVIEHRKSGIRISMETTDLPVAVLFNAPVEEVGETFALEHQLGPANAINLSHEADKREDEELRKFANIGLSIPGRPVRGSIFYRLEQIEPQTS